MNCLTITLVSTVELPGVLLAGTFGFEAKTRFEADAGSEDVPQVEF